MFIVTLSDCRIFATVSSRQTNAFLRMDQDKRESKEYPGASKAIFDMMLHILCIATKCVNLDLVAEEGRQPYQLIPRKSWRFLLLLP